jgi:hypothetical protein
MSAPMELQPQAPAEGLGFEGMVPPAMIDRFVRALTDPYRREPQQSIQERMLAEFRNAIVHGVRRAWFAAGGFPGHPPVLAVENAALRCAVKALEQANARLAAWVR